jgi:hypothetical protein
MYTPSTGENFTNIVEKGSLVSSIGTHIGTKIEIDAVSDAKTVIGVAFMRANLPIGLAMIVDGLVDNHKIQFMISYFKNNPNLNKWQLTNKQLEKLEYELETIVRELENDNPIDTLAAASMVFAT